MIYNLWTNCSLFFHRYYSHFISTKVKVIAKVIQNVRSNLPTNQPNFEQQNCTKNKRKKYCWSMYVWYKLYGWINCAINDIHRRHHSQLHYWFRSQRIYLLPPTILFLFHFFICFFFFVFVNTKLQFVYDRNAVSWPCN